MILRYDDPAAAIEGPEKPGMEGVQFRLHPLSELLAERYAAEVDRGTPPVEILQGFACFLGSVASNVVSIVEPDQRAAAATLVARTFEIALEEALAGRATVGIATGGASHA